AVKDANKASDEVKSMAGKFASAKGNAEKEEAASKSIVAGQFERANWLVLARFIGDSIPQPDGTNLPASARATYFDKTPEGHLSGSDAYKAWQQSRKEAAKAPMAPKASDGDPMPPRADEGPVSKLPVGIDDLVQFNIQSVDSRYCDDLAAFWKTALSTP